MAQLTALAAILVGLGWCALGGVHVSAQTMPEEGVLRSAVAEVDLTAPASIGVTIDFQVELAPDARSVPLLGLPFGTSAIETLEAFDVDGSALVVLREEDEGGRISIDVELPAEASGNFRLSYEVASGVRGEEANRRYTVPLVTPEWPPAEAVTGVFQLIATLREEDRVVMSFPAGLREVEANGLTRYELDLQVVPTLLTLSTRAEGGLRVTLEGFLDLLVIFVFLGAGALAHRHLRGTP